MPPSLHRANGFCPKKETNDDLAAQPNDRITAAGPGILMHHDYNKDYQAERAEVWYALPRTIDDT